MTVEDYLDKWLDSIRDTVKDRTWMQHEEVTRLHLKPAIGKVSLSRLNTLQLQNLYRARLDSGLSSRTVQIIHTTLNKALKQAIRWSLIYGNVGDVGGSRCSRIEAHFYARSWVDRIEVGRCSGPQERLQRLW